MQPILYIDLVKSKKGMSWRKHKYIARILLPNGEYAYIHPDEDEGHFDQVGDSWLFRLASGKSLSSIINRHIWGGYSGETNKAGIPKAPDGLFRTYVVVSNKTLEMQKQGMLSREDEKEGARRIPGNPYPNALSREKVGAYTIFTFPKVPLVGHTPEGKKRFGGYTHIDWNSAVVGKYAYQEPKELLNHRVTEPEEIAAAQRFHDYVKEGGGTGDPNTLVGTTTPTTRFKNTPRTTEETQAALGVSLTDKGDPLSVAKLLRDRLTSRVARKNKGRVGAGVAPEQDARIGKFPQDMIDRYGGEQNLLDALSEKPATTLVSLGVIKVTRHSHALLKKIHEEWRRDIVRGSRSGWEAHKWTALYARYKKLDERDGLDMTDENSRLRKLRSSLSSDLIQDGFEHLQKVILSADPSNIKRLDSYIATSLRNHMNRLGDQWARKEQLSVELVEDHNIEEAAHKNKQTVPLSPKDGAELAEITPVALHAIDRVLNTEHFPDTLRRVLVARLYLNAHSAEAADIALHERREADKRAAADAAGKTFRRSSRRMYREWEEVAHSLKTVTDPSSGETIDLTKMPSKNRDRKLLQWFTDGVDRIRKELSVGAKPEDMQSAKRREALANKLGIEPRTPWHTVDVDADPDSYTYAEKVFHANMKTKKKVMRLLTNEGQAVKRYFELEAKLAGAVRQHGTIKERIANESFPDTAGLEVDITKLPISRKLPEHKIGPVKHVLLIPAKDNINAAKPAHTMSPAIGFFTASKNQQLAAKLGLNLHHLHAGTGVGGAVWTQPNVKLGTHAQRALNTVESHYTQLQRYAKAPSERLNTAHKRNTAMLSAVQKLGRWVKNDRSHQSEWSEGDVGLSALHAAATELQSIHSGIQKKKAQRAAIRADFKQARGSVGPVEEHVHLTDSVLAHKLKVHEITEQEKQAHGKAIAQYEKISNRVGALIPSIKDIYDTALSKVKVSPEELTVARAHVTSAFNAHRAQQALIEFEKDRRAALKNMKKSWMHADELTAAIYNYDFELGRLDAELEAA